MSGKGNREAGSTEVSEVGRKVIELDSAEYWFLRAVLGGVELDRDPLYCPKHSLGMVCSYKVEGSVFGGLQTVCKLAPPNRPCKGVLMKLWQA